MAKFHTPTTIQKWIEADRLEVLNNESQVEIKGNGEGYHLDNVVAIRTPEARLPVQIKIRGSGGEFNTWGQSLYAPGLFNLHHTSTGSELKFYSTDLTIGWLEGEDKIRLSEDFVATAKMWAEQYNVPYGKLKERNGVTKDKSLIQFITTVLGNRKDVESTKINEESLKYWLESRKTKTGYLYRVDTAGMTKEEMEATIAEIYTMHRVTNTSSCMVKGDVDCENGVGLDYYTGHLHPFHAYRADNWGVIFVSRHAPDVVKNWDKEKSPFIARAWSYFDGDDYTYVNSYGDTMANRMMITFVRRNTNLEGVKIRCYEYSDDAYIAPYVDGDYQNIYINEEGATVHSDDSGDEYVLGVISDDGNFEPSHSEGLVTRKERREWCEIYREDFPEEDMVWSNDLEGYVHQDFWDFNRDCLDGYAIYKYYTQ